MSCSDSSSSNHSSDMRGSPQAGQDSLVCSTRGIDVQTLPYNHTAVSRAQKIVAARARAQAAACHRVELNIATRELAMKRAQSSVEAQLRACVVLSHRVTKQLAKRHSV